MLDVFGIASSCEARLYEIQTQSMQAHNGSHGQKNNWIRSLKFNLSSGAIGPQLHKEDLTYPLQEIPTPKSNEHGPVKYDDVKT